MKLPSKTTPYSNSVISLFPRILKSLQKTDLPVSELYRQCSDRDYGDFISALDCLYALGRLEIDEERRLLHYVG